MRRPILVALCLAVAGGASRRLVPAVHGSDPPATELMSVNTAGLPASGPSGSDDRTPSPPRNRISADGRYVVFESFAGDLVCVDVNFSSADVFVRDRLTGTTVLASVAYDGSQGNWNSYDPSISPDGRYVVFSSGASNLVPGDTNGFDDIFIRDLQAGTTQMVSVSMTGGPSDSVAHGPVVSAGGRYVAWYSNATNLVPGDVNGTWDVFVRDMWTGTTERISAAPGETFCCGGTDPSISDDGRYVGFMSQSRLDPAYPNSFLNIFVHDMVTGENHLAGLSDAGGVVESIFIGGLSGDGRHVVFDTYHPAVTPDANGFAHDIFLRDLDAGTTVLVSQSSTGVQGNHDSFMPSVSADGRFVAFHSWSNNLVPGDTSTGVQYDVFVRDILLGTTTRVDVGMGGAEASGNSEAAAVSADGSLVFFQSTGTNLVPGDSNGVQDVFVYGPPYAGAARSGFAFSASAFAVAENSGAATITVVRNGPTCATATVQYATAAGSATSGADYTETAGTLTFAAGEASRTFEVPILDDATDEPAETVALSLSMPSGAPLGRPAVATLTILDDDPPPNTPPVAQDDADMTSEDLPITVAVLANDSDLDGDPLAITAYTNGTHGAVAVNPDETITYTPAPDSNGADSFTYTIADGRGGSASATVRLIVVPVNDAPVAADDVYGARAGLVLDVAAPGLLANDTDVDSAGLTVALVTAATHGDAHVNADGSFTYTSAPGFVGADSFTYVASDGAVSSNVATVTVEVTAIAIVPVAGTTTPIPGGAGAFTSFPGAAAIDGRAAAFLGAGAAGQLGLYVAQPGGSPIRLADLGMLVPGGAGTFTAIGDYSLVAIPGDPCRRATFLGAGSGGQSGVYLAASCDAGQPQPPPIRIADLSTLIPSGAGTFTSLSRPRFVAQPGDPCREAALLGNGAGGQQGVYMFSSCDAGITEPPPIRLANLATPIPSGTGTFTGISNLDLIYTPGDPCRKAAFVGSGSGGQQGVYIASGCEAGVQTPPSPIRLADARTAIPGGQGAFVAFGALALGGEASIPNPPPIRVAFIGSGSGGQQGVYLTTTAATPVTPPNPIKVADLTTAIPEGSGTFTGFAAVSASAQHIAFLATGAGGQKGIYLASTLTKVVDLRDTLLGKPIADLRFSTDGLGDDIVFAATFADGSDGVFHVVVDRPGVNEPPIASADAYRVDQGTTLAVPAPGVLVNDHDVDSPSLTAVLMSSPAHGTVALNSDGGFTYTPAASFSGTDTFTYGANDGAAISSPSTVTITVDPEVTNRGPVARDDAYLLHKGTFRLVGPKGVLANDNDPEGRPLTASLAHAPAHGIVVLGPGGGFLYIPAPAFTGVDAFTYRASDGVNASSVATVRLVVYAPAHEPTAGNVSR